MVSRTKFDIRPETVKKLFHASGLGEAVGIRELGAGEYNALFSVETKEKEYVLKIAPDPAIPVLTYEKNMMAAELFWYEQMKKSTSISVPEIYFRDLSRTLIPADYFIMEKVCGEQLDAVKLSAEEKAEVDGELARMAAQIHRIQNDRFGYIQNDLYEDWYQALTSFVSNLLEDCAAVGKRSRRGEKLLKCIRAHRETFQKAECGMVNFDLWPANILCRRKNGKVEYVWIDPERSFWGDRIADFACLELMKPLEKKKKSLTAYNTVAQNPILCSDDEKIRYAAAIGYFSLILETEKYYRYTPRHFGWWRNVLSSAVFYKKAFRALKSNGWDEQ